jgi:ABC-2 type transport system permease protein
MNNKTIALLSYKALYSYQDLKTYLTFRVLDPMLHYLFFALIGLSILGNSYLQYVIVGNIIFFTAQTLITNLIVIFRYERLFETLILNIASPISTFRIVLIRLIIPILDASLVLIISFSIAKLFFKINIQYLDIPIIMLYSIVMLFSLAGIALILASFGLVFRNVNLYLNLSLAVLLNFCGINFPTKLFPDMLEKITLFLPITNSLLAIRAVLDGKSVGETYQYILIELILGVVYFTVALFLIKLLERISRENASLFKT